MLLLLSGTSLVNEEPREACYLNKLMCGRLVNTGVEKMETAQAR